MTANDPAAASTSQPGSGSDRRARRAASAASAPRATTAAVASAVPRDMAHSASAAGLVRATASGSPPR
ncbi:MAG: hypothetical protein GEV08_24540 [Acidimicrobiia bacterium]|nr:hypothetical protein [Acidimicrobiia bacterium]